MKSSVVPRRHFYEYDPDANSFAGVGFPVLRDASDGVTEIHRIDKPLSTCWKLKSCHGFDDNPPDPGDFPTIVNYRKIPLMSERAWNCLQPIIGEVCEALPVIHPFKGTYFIIHVMNTIDALDTDESEVTRSLVGDHRVNGILRYAFRDELIEGYHIFKLPRISGSGLIVDDVFRQTVELNGLRGLRFKELPVA